MKTLVGLRAEKLLGQGALVGYRETNSSLGIRVLPKVWVLGNGRPGLGFRIGILSFHQASPHSELLDLALSPLDVGLCLSSLHVP